MEDATVICRLQLMSWEAVAAILVNSAIGTCCAHLINSSFRSVQFNLHLTSGRVCEQHAIVCFYIAAHTHARAHRGPLLDWIRRSSRSVDQCRCLFVYCVCIAITQTHIRYGDEIAQFASQRTSRTILVPDDANAAALRQLKLCYLLCYGGWKPLWLS